MHGINQANGVELSFQSVEEFSALVGKATYKVCVDPQAAFLLAFDQDAGIEGPNYNWFRQRYTSFLYIDRIAVSAESRRQGLGELLYRTLIAEASERGYQRLACEVNSDPPNPVSDAFHAGFGFAEVGMAELTDRGKTVRYFVRDLIL